jgi:uncharacterized MnhB-related membrane protein
MYNRLDQKAYFDWRVTMGWALEVFVALIIIGVILSICSGDEGKGCLGCGFTILLIVIFFLLIGAGNVASTEESKPVVYTTHLVALSDSAGTSGDFFLGCGTVGATPTYFYAQNTEKGIVQETLVKDRFQIYIQEESGATSARLERRLVATRRHARAGWWWGFVFNACGTNADWQEDAGNTEYYFVVPKGTVRTGARIDTE